MPGNIEIKGMTATACKRKLARFRMKGGGTTVERAMLPFYVRLPVDESASEQGYDGVFVYADNESHAGPLAFSIWQKWRQSETVRMQYPQIRASKIIDAQGNKQAESHSVKIDDEDYAEFWKSAKKLPHYFVGEPQDPAAFMVIGQEIFGISDTKRKKHS